MLERLYCAGALHTSGWDLWVKEMIETERMYVLESFWYGGSIKNKFNKSKHFKLFLDSGAFSWYNSVTKKGQVPTAKDKQEYMDRYIAFIKEFPDRWHCCANLDVIGDPEQTWKNQKYMEEQGATPIPVFHYTHNQADIHKESAEFDYFIRYIEEYPYIAVGGGASSGLTRESYVERFGDKVFGEIENRGLKTKVHGFGVTSFMLMKRYPWYSVDSTSWIQYSANGRVLIPQFDLEGEPIFDDTPNAMFGSAVSREMGRHFDLCLSDMERERVHRYFDELHPLVNVPDLEKYDYIRNLANFLFFENFVNSTKGTQSELKGRTFF